MVDTGVLTRSARAHLDFAWRLHRALTAAVTETACWSPYSVAAALGLAAQGAAGDTRAELEGLLGGELDEHAALLAGAAELADDGAAEPPLLAVSNTLWARPDIAVTERFGEQLRRWPNGSIADAPFSAEPEAARRMINQDVADTTRGLIPELIPPGALTASTVAALVNALYLKVGWRHRFAERATRPEPFTGAGEVPTMRLTERLGYAHHGGWQVVVLPAAGGVEAVVLLPDAELPTAEPALDAATLAELLAQPRTLRVELHLPRFRMEVASPLTEVLRQLGVRAMFRRDADFSRLSPDPLHVSDVLHKAVLRLDEQGLEGAAATAVMMKLAAFVREEQPLVVRVDRPFLLLVRHAATGAVYFLARVVRP